MRVDRWFAVLRSGWRRGVNCCRPTDCYDPRKACRFVCHEASDLYSLEFRSRTDNYRAAANGDGRNSERARDLYVAPSELTLAVNQTKEARYSILFAGLLASTMLPAAAFAQSSMPNNTATARGASGRRRVEHSFSEFRSSLRKPGPTLRLGGTSAAIGLSPWTSTDDVLARGLAIICSNKGAAWQPNAATALTSWFGGSTEKMEVTAFKSLFGVRGPDYRFRMFFVAPGAWSRDAVLNRHLM